jgi:hypothetical protein
VRVRGGEVHEEEVRVRDPARNEKVNEDGKPRIELRIV